MKAKSRKPLLARCPDLAELHTELGLILQRWKQGHLSREQRKPVKPSKTTAGPILRLLTEMVQHEHADGVPFNQITPWAEAIADACMRCPDSTFASDVRWEGDPSGKDYSRNAGTVFRIVPKSDSGGADWERRLEVALAWQAAGCPTRDWTATPKRDPIAERGKHHDEEEWR